MRFYSFSVSDSVKETNSATRVVFDVPAEHADLFRWKAGQHLVLRFVLNGAEERRTYTISASPDTADGLCITVKRVRDGKVSNHINERIGAGDRVEVAPPVGKFVLVPAGKDERRTYYFFGAGSGITPLYAMLRGVLTAEQNSYIFLLYGNSKPQEVIFAEQLQQLAERYRDRFVVRHIYSGAGGGWRKGRIDNKTVAEFVAENPPLAYDTAYFVCGPGDMNKTVASALRAIDVPPERIHAESFGGDTALIDDTVEGVESQTRIKLDGQRLQLNIPKGKTVLQAVLEAGYDPPYSCQSGVCGTCRAAISKGEVHMYAPLALTPKDIEDGEVLTCQAIAKTPEIELSYDD